MSPEELKALEDYYAENPEPTERDIDAEYREHCKRSGASFGLQCRCGSRNTKRIGQSGLLRQCQTCMKTYAWRFMVDSKGNSAMVPLGLLTAEALDEERAR